MGINKDGFYFLIVIDLENNLVSKGGNHVEK